MQSVAPLFPGCPLVTSKRAALLGGRQTERFGEGDTNQPDSQFGTLLLVGEIGLVPAPTGEDKSLLPVPPVLSVWQHREVWNAAPGRVPARRWLICTHRETLHRHTGPYSVHQGRQPRALLLPGVMLSGHVLKGESKATTSVTGKGCPDAQW